MLDHAKDAFNPRIQSRVYAIPFSCGKQYIGETGRSFQVNIKEHCADIKHNRSKNSSLAEHFEKSGHHICIKNTKFITKMEYCGKRKIREAL